MNLTYADVQARIAALDLTGMKIYGIPRGGSVVAAEATRYGAVVVHKPELADVIVDDVIDSGVTADIYNHTYQKPVLALVNKIEEEINEWVVFPWEPSQAQDGADTVRRLIEHIGDNPARHGIEDTPDRVVRSWQELYAGYGDPPTLTWFQDDTDEMIISRGIRFYSMCEHHMLPFFGTADVGYIPDGQVVGISKLSRLVTHYAKRLQIQERLARDIGEALAPNVNGVAVHIAAQHMCMMARGVSQDNSIMTTNYLTGVFRDNPETRSEFLCAIKETK